jgi:hypothetical protein
MKKKCYEVWMTQGQGSGDTPDETFPTLQQALKFVEKHKGECSFAIRLPNGKWHTWDE